MRECVRKRERECVCVRERETFCEKEDEGKRAKMSHRAYDVIKCVCVHVCETGIDR